jgi:hypothetical protein
MLLFLPFIVVVLADIAGKDSATELLGLAIYLTDPWVIVKFSASAMPSFSIKVIFIFTTGTCPTGFIQPGTIIPKRNNRIINFFIIAHPLIIRIRDSIILLINSPIVGNASTATSGLPGKATNAAGGLIYFSPNSPWHATHRFSTFLP